MARHKYSRHNLLLLDKSNPGPFGLLNEDMTLSLYDVLGGGGGLMVSMLVFCYKILSLNPADLKFYLPNVV